MSKRKRNKQQPQQTKGTTVSNTTKKVIKQLRNMEGLMDCALEHTIENTSLTYEWKGPKITREVWNEVLAFFKWTFTAHGSESQVRMFVHPLHGWKAWAFPQKARTGMSAHELDLNEPGYERTIEQRKQFNPDEGWVYFGTVHHHCSASAFQSGTDQNNEVSQDGIHITVGNIAADIHSIDMRFYYCGSKLAKFDMSWAWDIGNELDVIPKHLRSLMPDNLDHITAMRQMCVTCPADTPFNAVWKENVIEPPKAEPRINNHDLTPSNHTSGWQSPGKFGRYFDRRDDYLKRCFPSYTMDTDSAILTLKEWIRDHGKKHNVTMADVEKFFILLSTWEPFYIEWLDIALNEDCNIPAMANAIEECNANDSAIDAQELALEKELAHIEKQIDSPSLTPDMIEEAKQKEIEDHLSRLYGDGGMEY